MVRVKKRYFVLQLQSERDVEATARGRPISSCGSLQSLGRDGALGSAIKDLVTELHGDFGRAAVTVGLRSIYANTDTGLCLVQARHGPHRLVASALPFLTKINDEKVVPRVIYTGATVRNCYKVSSVKHMLNSRQYYYYPNCIFQVMERFQTEQLQLALKTLKKSSSAEDEKARRVLKEKMMSLRQMRQN